MALVIGQPCRVIFYDIYPFKELGGFIKSINGNNITVLYGQPVTVGVDMFGEPVKKTEGVYDIKYIWPSFQASSFVDPNKY